MKNWSVFISGRGTNLKALLDKHAAMIKLVVSSKAEAPGIQYAKQYKVPVFIFDKNQNWDSLHLLLKDYQINYIFLAGFMKILPQSFISHWQKKILNLHPSLLPSYPGLDSIARSYQDKADMGVTVHYVTAEVDAGEIILQEVVIPSPEVGRYSLPEAEALIHKKEHELVCRAVELV